MCHAKASYGAICVLPMLLLSQLPVYSIICHILSDNESHFANVMLW